LAFNGIRATAGFTATDVLVMRETPYGGVWERSIIVPTTHRHAR
jgi:hypothetical protein